MEDFIIIAILLVIICLAAGYIIRAKKRGAKCIGCPNGCCSSKKNSCSSCCCSNTEVNSSK